MTIAIDTVCTHADLVREVVSADRLNNLLPPEWNGDTTAARQHGLDRVLRSLSRRRPPIVESDLTDATELKVAVLYATLEHLFGSAQHTDDGAFGLQRKRYEERYVSEISGLTPKVGGGLAGPPLSIGLSRR